MKHRHVVVPAALLVLSLVVAVAHPPAAAHPPGNAARNGTTIAPSASSGTAGLEAALAGVRASALRAHVTFLASDLLEGRGTATRGHDLAAAYVAAQFEAIGLEPGGTDGWFQPVPFRRSDLDAAGSHVTLIRGATPEELGYEEGFVMSGDALRERSAIEAPVVFAGFGVTAPEFRHDDYAGLDVRGRIVCLLRGAPPSFPHDERAYYSWTESKLKNAVARGAAGVLTLRTPEAELRAPWTRVVRQSKLARFEWLDARGAPDGVFPAIRGAATLSRAGAERLFDGAAALDSAIARAETGRRSGTVLPVRARIVTTTRLARVSSPNVVGILRGSDPKLRDEFVVYSAHLDHLGISTPVDGDSINNGAYDNASGVAAMIEAARALAQLPVAPRRSIVFLATTAEEKGLLGAGYFAAHPTVPARAIVANVNLDMFVMVRPVTGLIAFGAEHSSLAGPVGRAARAEGFELVPDPTPEEVVFIRSDQFPFVRRGVPAIFLSSGSRGTDEYLQWTRTIYHAPGDDLSQPFDWDSGVRFTRANVRLGLEVADDTARPLWNRGDFFGRRFGAGRTARR